MTQKHKLPTGWQEAELGRIAECLDGDWILSNDMSEKGQIGLVQLKHVGEGNFLIKSFNFITKEKAKELKCTILKSGDLLVSRMADPICRSCILPYFDFETITVVDVTVIRPNEGKTSREYLNIVFNSLIVKNQVGNFVTGTTRARISRKNLEKIKIPLPPLSTQKSIVAILEKAEALKRQREEADTLTQEYLKSVFYEMFHNKGFEERKMDDLFEIVRGGSPRPIQEYITEDKNGYNWIKIGDAKENSKYIERTEEKIKPEGLKKTRLVKRGDFILSNSMSFGRPYILKIDGCIHDGWLAIRNKKGLITNDYLYAILGSEYVYNQFLRSVSGSTVKNLKIEVVKKVSIPLPPLALQQRFATIVEHVEKMKEVQAQSKRHIEELFNSLMQRAFNGELVK